MIPLIVIIEFIIIRSIIKTIIMEFYSDTAIPVKKFAT